MAKKKLRHPEPQYNILPGEDWFAEKVIQDARNNPEKAEILKNEMLHKVALFMQTGDIADIPKPYLKRMAQAFDAMFNQSKSPIEAFGFGAKRGPKKRVDYDEIEVALCFHRLLKKYKYEVAIIETIKRFNMRPGASSEQRVKRIYEDAKNVYRTA